jgi:hypothetical protein
MQGRRHINQSLGEHDFSSKAGSGCAVSRPFTFVFAFLQGTNIGKYCHHCSDKFVHDVLNLTSSDHLILRQRIPGHAFMATLDQLSSSRSTRILGSSDQYSAVV